MMSWYVQLLCIAETLREESNCHRCILLKMASNVTTISSKIGMHCCGVFVVVGWAIVTTFTEFNFCNYRLLNICLKQAIQLCGNPLMNFIPQCVIQYTCSYLSALIDLFMHHVHKCQHSMFCGIAWALTGGYNYVPWWAKAKLFIDKHLQLPIRFQCHSQETTFLIPQNSSICKTRKIYSSACDWRFFVNT